MAFDWDRLHTQNTWASLEGEPREEEWSWNPGQRVEASIQESFGAIWGGIGAIADTLGMDSASEWAVNRSSELFEKAADHDIVNTDFSTIENPLDFFKWGAETLTSYAPDLILMAAGGVGAGSLAGKVGVTKLGHAATKGMLKKGLDKNLKKIVADETKDWSADKMYKEAFRQTAKETGALLGVSGVEGFQGAGQAFLKDQELRGEDASGITALGVGVTQSAIALLNPLNKVLAGRMPKGKTSIIQMTVGETAEEMGQEAVALAHEGGVDPNKTFGELFKTKEGAMRLFESGVAGALLGGTFGGGLSAIRDRKVSSKEKVLEKPEEVLNTKGIDTSKDTVVGTDVGPVQAESKPFIGPEVNQETRDIPRVSSKLLQQPTYAQSERGGAEIATDQYGPDIPPQAPGTVEGLEAGPVAPGFVGPLTDPNTKDIPEVTDEGIAQYQTPERKRSIEAAKAIAEVNWEALETNDVEVGETIDKLVMEESTTTPEQSANLTERKVQKEAETVRKAEVSEKVEAAKVIIEKAREEGTSVDAQATKQAKTVAEVQKEEEVIEATEVVRKATAEEKQDKENEEILKTTEEKRVYNEWQAKTNEVDGKKITTYHKDKNVIVKYHSDRYDLIDGETGSPVNQGRFKTMKDAQAANEAGQTADEFYNKTKTKVEEKKEAPLSEKAMSLLNSIDPKKLAQRAMASTGTQEESWSESAAIEGIINAARNYKGKEDAFITRAFSAANFAIKDRRKKTGVEVQAPVTSNAEGETTTDAIDTATKESTDLTAAPKVQKTKEEKVEAAPVTKVVVSQQEKDEILKRAQEDRAKQEKAKGRKSKVTKLKEKAAKKGEGDPSLDALTIDQEVEVAETGEVASIKVNAKEALQLADNNIEMLYKIKGCLI